MTRRSAVSQSPLGYHPEILVNMIGEDREISDAEWQAEIDRIRESERIEYGMALASGKVDNCDVVRCVSILIHLVLRRGRLYFSSTIPMDDSYH